MAYEINIHVNKNGKLETDEFPLELSVYRESKRVKLIFDVDSEIDAEYHYLKFTHKRVSYLYRVHSNEFEIPKAVTAYEGRWEMSFVCCDETANSDSTITANYIYASEPVVADVIRGNLGIIHTSEEFTLLSQLVEGSFDHFEIPSGVSFITENFLQGATNEFTVYIPHTVTTIKAHAFYESGCTAIEFEGDSELATLEANALYRITNLSDITFPKSLSSWGAYNLSGCGCEYVYFESTSNLRDLTSYAFWNIPNLKKLYLPDRLLSFAGGTAVVKGCPVLNEIWFPNTINVPIPLESIQECPLLTKISLQSNFNVNANFGNCTSLTRESVIQMFRNLKDLTGAAPKVISLHQSVIDILENEDLDIATDKNWTIGIVGGVDPLANKHFHYENSSTSIDIDFGEGIGCISSDTLDATVNITYEYLSDSTFKITLVGDYVENSWGGYRPAPVGERINETGIITFSSGEVSTIKIKTYSANNVGTNRTFSVVTEEN